MDNISQIYSEENIIKQLKELQTIAKVGFWEYNYKTGVFIYDDFFSEIFNIEKNLSLREVLDIVLKQVYFQDYEKMESWAYDLMYYQNNNNIEIRIVKNHQLMWLKIEHNQLIDNENCEITSGKIQDITEQKCFSSELEKAREELDTILFQTDDTVFIIDVSLDGRFTYNKVNYSEPIQAMYPVNLLGKTPLEVYGIEQGRKIVAHYRDCIEQRGVIVYKEDVEINDNKYVFFTSLKPVFTDGRINQITGISKDITEYTKTDQLMHQYERKLNVIFKGAKISVWDWDIKTDTLTMDENVLRIFNCSIDDVPKKFTDYLNSIHINDVKEFREQITDLRMGNVPYIHSEHRVSLISGKQGYRWISTTGSVTEYNIETKKASVISGIFFDITRRKKEEEKVHYMALHDDLTKLNNRNSYDRAMKQLDKPENLPLSVLFCDINGLKMVNDAFGNRQGDKVIKLFADILNSNLSRHFVSRIAGDEFAVIMANTGRRKAELTAKEIKEKYEEDDSQPIPVTVSIGHATKTSEEQSINEIVKKSEEIMNFNKLMESQNTKNSIFSSLIKTLEERTTETKDHSMRLDAYAVKIARELGLNDEEYPKLNLLAAIHDIGKISIPDRILNKPGALDNEEWEIMKTHCEAGYRIAISSHQLSPVAEDILSHHERWDGTGYPRGLKGEEIPVRARILTVVDSYDAMTNTRVYRKALPKSVALAEIKKNAGSQFDPEMTKIFVSILEKEADR
jgi:diguanylate cyclase (GGDEF)-like protein